MLGLFANIALSLALLYILALLSLFQATLTLPGIAGIILTMGMAVDANVLIYERIKEELHKGISNLYAIRTGFESAFATILMLTSLLLIVAFYFIYWSRCNKRFCRCINDRDYIFNVFGNYHY